MIKTNEKSTLKELKSQEKDRQEVDKWNIILWALSVMRRIKQSDMMEKDREGGI